MKEWNCPAIEEVKISETENGYANRDLWLEGSPRPDGKGQHTTGAPASEWYKKHPIS